MKAESLAKEHCLQMNSAEHERYAGGRRSHRLIWRERDSAGPALLEKILNKDNLNRAYKRVKANHGAPGIDGMSIEEALVWLKENGAGMVEDIYRGKYTPQPVRRKEIAKPDGGVRKLGIPTVVDRIIQQAAAQQLAPIYEPLFADESYGYRPGRSAQGAINKVREYAEEGYTQAVVLDLSKYFDTINHERLLNILRRNITDERVIQLIKRFLKSGVMDQGVFEETEAGSPQGGPLSPLLSLIYLNEFDQEFAKRGVRFVRYADDIAMFAKSKRAAERLLNSSVSYLEGNLGLTVNRTKSRVVSVFSATQFKYLGFALGKNRNGVYVRVHPKSLAKFKSNLRSLSSRRHAQSILSAFRAIRLYVSGWLNYYGIAAMRQFLIASQQWLNHRIRMCIWKQWKLPRTKLRNLLNLGIGKELAYNTAYSRKAYWRVSNSQGVKMALPNEKLYKWGLIDMVAAYTALAR